MFSRSPQILLRSCLLVLCCACLPSLSVAGVHAAPLVPQILVLNSYNNGYDWSDAEMQGLRSTLSQKFARVDLLVEHLDTKRFHDKKHFPQLATLFASKYRGQRFDIIIAMDNAAFEFAMRYRDRLYPDIPLVFCGINDYEPGMISGRHKVTGVAEFHDSAGTLAMALRLPPGTREVVVIHDYSATGLAMRRELVRQASKFTKVRLRSLEQIPIEKAVQQLGALPSDTLVLMLSYTVEKGGRSFTQSEIARIVTSASSVPVYAVHAAQLGSGVVGGRMLGGRIQGEQAAELAIRIISGEAAEGIPVLTRNLSRAMFDDAALGKFKIDRERLPSEALIINRPVSFYAVNKATFWVAAIIAVFMTAGLLTLYLNNQRRRRLEKVLQITEAKFRQLFDSAGDAIYIHDFNFQILEVNQAACDRMGYSHEQLLRLSLKEINAPEQRWRLPERMIMVQRQGRALYESMHVTSCGEMVPIEVSSRAIEYQEGPAILSIVRDISKRKRIELREKTRLKILEEMATGSGLEALLVYIVHFVEQESPGALCSVLLADDSGTRLRHGAAPSLPDFYNQAVSGLRVKEGMGSCGTAAFMKKRVIVEDIETHPYWKDFKPARDAGLRACWSEPVLSTGGDLLGTFAIYYRSCRSPSEEELALIESAAHMASIAIDRVRSDESRAHLEEQMRQMQKIEAVGQLAGGLAHDFNNLLTPIFVYADIIKRGFSTGDANWKRMDGILLSAQMAADLTKKLLSFGRKQILTMEMLELNDVIVSLLDLLQRTIRANIEIKTNLTPLGASIFADRCQIEQILVNFAVNAQDAITGNGAILIETGNVILDDEFTKLNPGMRRGAHALLSFTDNGCGMNEEVMRHIFEPFYTTKPVGHGTGLGLATVYGIVKQHNGYIKAVSQAGQGTSFLVYLPRPAGEAKADKHQQRPAEKLPRHAGGATVLVVDDNEMIREMAVELLQASGYRVLIAETPLKAQQIMDAPEASVDLLVTDVVMPEMSGPELYERLCAKYPTLPVLYISGYTFDVNVHNRLQHKGVGFLPKPFTSEQFLDGIEQAVSRAGFR